MDDPVTAFSQRFPNLPSEGVERRTRSVRQLQAEGVAVNSWLPVIETADEVSLPDKEAIIDRATALVAVALKGEGLEPEYLDRFVERTGANAVMTPKERAFMQDDQASENDNVQFSWRYASALVLFWSLGQVDELGPPDAPRDPGEFIRLLRDVPREDILARVSMRSEAEVLDAVDLIYRYRWAVVDAQINDKPMPPGVHPGIALERQWALNWLVRHDQEEWDFVMLDT